MYWGCSSCQMQDKRFHEQVRFKCIKRKRPTRSISFAVSFVCLPGCSMWFSLHSACKERERISPWPGLYFLLLGLGCEQMKGVLHSGKTSPWEKNDLTWPTNPSHMSLSPCGQKLSHTTQNKKPSISGRVMHGHCKASCLSPQQAKGQKQSPSTADSCFYAGVT